MNVKQITNTNGKCVREKEWKYSTEQYYSLVAGMQIANRAFIRIIIQNTYCHTHTRILAEISMEQRSVDFLVGKERSNIINNLFMVQLDGCWYIPSFFAVLLLLLWPWLNNDARKIAGKIVIVSFTSFTQTRILYIRAAQKSDIEVSK